jgi:hypothetical protein
MMMRLIVQRVLIPMLLGILIAIGVNEFSFLFLKSEAGRAPQRIDLVIPLGTAEKVARGESNPALPDKMVFVIGDTLVVKNEDVADHRLGPLFIPVGTSASLTLSESDNVAFSCSFQPSRYLGLDVREPVTFSTRLYGILIAGIPLGFLLGLYSLVVWPLKRATQKLE